MKACRSVLILLVLLALCAVAAVAQSFTAAASPATLQTIPVGNSKDFTATFTGLGGFNQPITVDCSALPAGMSCSANPASVLPGVPSTVTVSTTAGVTPLQTTTFQITGDSSGITGSSNNLQLKATDFSLTSIAVGNVLVNDAGSGTRSVQAKSLNGFTGTVTLACAVVGSPTGVTCTVPASTTTSATGISFTATVNASADAAAGNYTITVTGVNSGQQRMYSFTAQVKDFTLAPSTGAITIPQPPPGQSSSVALPVTITGLNGFNTSTAFACTGQPAGMTCAFAPASIIPTPSGVISTLTVTSSSTVAVNVFALQIKGTAGTLIRQQPLSVTTGGHNFTQAATPTAQNVTAGSSTQYTVTYTPFGGMTDDIAVGCGALPLGVTCGAVPSVVTPGTTPGNQSVVTLTTTSGTTPAANATVAISGNSAAIGVTRSNNVTLSVKDFTVTANTATVTTNVGTNITDTILVKGLNGFTGVVNLGCVIVGAPAGTNCTLSNANPAATSTGASVTATITSTAATTPFGTYTVQVTGTNSAQSKMASFTVNIKDFALGLGTGAITIPQPPPGQSSTVTVPVTLTAENGFNTSTALSCTGQPAGVTCAFAPASLVPTMAGINSTLTLTGASTAAPGPHIITVKGTAGTLIRQQVITVTLWGHNFTQAVTPTTQNVTAGSSTQYTVTYSPFGGMTDDIAVGCGTLPLGVTCTPVPAVVTPGTTPNNQSVVTLGTTFGTTPGANSTVAISGVSAALNNLSRSTNVTLSVKDFAVTANTATVFTNVGTNITDTILVKGLNGFTGVVNLGCVIVGAPAGTNCALSNVNPAATSTGASVTATISSTAGTTPFGSYTVQVTGTNSAQSKRASFTVNIKDFALGLGAGAITIPRPPPGQSSTVTVPVTLTAQNGFNTSTALTCTGQPAGVTCAFAPPSGIPTIGGLNSTLTVTAASTVPVNTYNLQVKATAGTLIHQQPLSVMTWGPNFTQAVTPTTQNVTNGNSTTFTVTFTPFGGMTDPITVGCGALPAGVTCTPNPAQVTPGITLNNQSIVTLQTIAGSTPAANATVALTGSGDGVNRSTNVTLSVKDFKLQPTSASIFVNAGSNVTDSISLQALNSFSGTLALSCTVVGSPTGLGCTFPASGNAGTSQTLTVTTTASAAPGSYSVQVSGSNGGESRNASVTVNVKSISVGAAPAIQAVLSNGGQANYTVTTTALNGFTGAVTLSCVTPLPTGITCGFGPTNTATLSVTPTNLGTNTNLRVNVANGTPVSQYSLNVKAALGTTLTPTTPIAINVGVPSIVNITPSTGAWGQTVTISGVAFDPTLGNNHVDFNGIAASVVGASTTALNVVVPPGSSTGNVTVTSFAISNAAPFTVQNLVPTVSTVTPNALTAGTPAATMITLSGTDFVPGLPGAQVQLDGTNIPTNFVSPTQITATVSQAQTASAHVYTLTVINPAPGGGTSGSSNFVITPVDDSKSTVVAVPNTNVLANNAATSTITVTLKNSASAGVSGQTVQVASSGTGDTISAPAITNGSGIATFTIKSTKAELKTISATVTLNPGGNLFALSAQPTVGFKADTSTLSAGSSTAIASPATGVLADGTSQSAITVQLLDAFGNAIPGQTVSLAATGTGNILSSPGITDANGQYFGNIASTVAEVKTITVTANPGGGQTVLSTQPTVTFVTPVARFAYVANSGDNTVSGYTLDLTTGQLRHNGYALTGASPSAVATDTAGKFLYVANSGSASVSGYTIASDGFLNPMPGSPFATGTTAGAAPKALSVDPSGKFLFVANGGDETVTTFDIDPVTGGLSSSSNIATGVLPSGLLNVRGKYLYAANKTSANISGYSIDPNTGVLSTLGSSPFGSGTNPVALAADRSARFVYAVNNDVGTPSVTSYTIDLNSGTLANTGTAVTGAGPNAIVVHPAGTYAYVANSGGSVSMFSVSQIDGQLSSLGTLTLPVVTPVRSPSTITMDPSGQYVFVGSSGSNDVSIFSVNGGTGLLTAVTATSATVRARVSPAGMVVIQGASAVTYIPKFAYVAQDSGNVSAFSVNTSTGALASIAGGVGGLADSRSDATDIRGKILLVGLFGGSSVRSYKISNAGALTFVNSASAGTSPFAVAIDPSGRFAYTANKGSTNISQFTVSQSTGAIARNLSAGETGTASRDITADPTGRFVYTANDGTNRVTGYKINANGTLTQVPGSQMGLTGAFGVKVDPSGRFLYAVGSTSGLTSVAIYSINPADGSLSSPSNGPQVLSSPHSVEVSPNGKFVFAANTGSATVSGFSVNQSTGGLGNIGTGDTGNNSFQVRCDPSGKFLYVPNKLSANVSVFSINPSTGALSKVGDQGGLAGPHQIAFTGVLQ